MRRSKTVATATRRPSLVVTYFTGTPRFSFRSLAKSSNSTKSTSSSAPSRVRRGFRGSPVRGSSSFRFHFPFSLAQRKPKVPPGILGPFSSSQMRSLKAPFSSSA
jgi:hypothetical protein